MRLDLSQDPAVIAMAESLEISEETVVGMLHKFWSWVSRNCNDGTVTGVTLVALERVLALPRFCEEMQKVGWLLYDDSDGTPRITIPKFDRHLSQSAKQRSLSTQRVKQSRSKPVNEDPKRKCNDNVTLSALPPLLFSSLLSDASNESQMRSAIEVPKCLDNAEFESAWADWAIHRKEIKKPLTSTSVRKQLKRMSSMGVDRAITMIEHTISNGWTGLREQDENRKPKGPSVGFT